MHDQLPGIEKRNVFSAEDVMRKDARLGKKVILLDETANWKGTGTAIQMAEQGHEVTVITAWPTVMAEMARTNADIYARQQMRKLGVTLLPETVIHLWQGDGAVIQSSGGDKKVVNADSLVIAETPVADTTVSDGLNKAEIDHTSIGDSIASRTAVMAIYEGRKLAQSI